MSAELSRMSAELSRMSAELSRMSAELSRMSARLSRMSAELSRMSARLSRMSAEPWREVGGGFGSLVVDYQQSRLPPFQPPIEPEDFGIARLLPLLIFLLFLLSFHL
jgi:chromosome segregation ATPase